MMRPSNVKQDAHQVKAYKKQTNLSWLIFFFFWLINFNTQFVLICEEIKN